MAKYQVDNSARYDLQRCRVRGEWNSNKGGAIIYSGRPRYPPHLKNVNLFMDKHVKSPY